ncbi:hypothetical protein PMHK_16380 [Pseudomonas sp. MHK4]
MSIEAKLLHLQSIQNLLAPYRYLYCVDLEATCDEVGESESPTPLAVVPGSSHSSTTVTPWTTASTAGRLMAESVRLNSGSATALILLSF